MLRGILPARVVLHVLQPTEHQVSESSHLESERRYPHAVNLLRLEIRALFSTTPAYALAIFGLMVVEV